MNIGMLSIGTGGTGGHNTLLKTLAKILDKEEIYIISEYDYGQLDTEKKINHIAIQQQKHQKSMSGKLKHQSSKEVIKAIKEKEIEHIIFSTFFDQDIIDYARKENIATTLVSYPLRDTFSQYFFTKGFDKNFDNIIILDDLVDMSIYQNNNTNIAKYPTGIKRRDEKEKKIFISCGGGGRPSAQRFFSMIKEQKEYLMSLKDYQIIISTGTYGNEEIKEEGNIKTYKWIDNFGEEASKSSLVIGEAGYFSIHELIDGRTPGIIIPGERRMDNQELRGVMYEKKGMGKVVFPQESSIVISTAIEEMLQENSLRNSQEAKNNYTARKNLSSLDQAIKEVIGESK